MGTLNIVYLLDLNTKYFRLEHIPLNDALGNLRVDTFTDFTFVAIHVGTINVTVSSIDGMLYGGGDLTRW